MKIKIALLGLLVANSTIYPICANQYESKLEADGVDSSPILAQDDCSTQDKASTDEAKSQSLIKIGATVKVDPCILYQDEVLSTKTSFGGKLTFKADIPKALCNTDATLAIHANWRAESFKIQDVALTIGKKITVGCTSSIFNYEKANPELPISGAATALQIKHVYAVDWLRIGYAIERAMPLEVGIFDKNKPEEEQGKVDDVKNAKRSFKIKNNFPAIGLSLGVATDELNIGLSSLGRYTDYTHSPNGEGKNLKSSYYLTYGGNLGIQYQVVPKKFTATAQGVYVHGLGDYLAGLAAIRSDNDRKEMPAAYYLDKTKNQLSAIDAWGLGATLEYCATPKWKLAIGGAYLTTVEHEDKPGKAFRAQWNLVPNVSYEVNKYFTLSGKYSLAKEFRVDEKKDKGLAHKLSGSIRFNLK